MLSGLLVCGECGASFCAQHRDRWGCNGAMQRGICTTHGLVGREALEDAVLRGIEALTDPEALAAAAKLAEEEVSRLLADRGAPDRLRAELGRIEERMARLVDLAADGDMAADLVRAKLAELEVERARLRGDLARASAALPEPGAVAEATTGRAATCRGSCAATRRARVRRCGRFSGATRSAWFRRLPATSSRERWT